jgi:hypothetical protein
MGDFFPKLGKARTRTRTTTRRISKGWKNQREIFQALENVV